MPQSLVKNYIHLVFGTYRRQPLIGRDVESELHKYLGGTCLALDCQPVVTGGMLDHIHMLFMLSKNKALTEVVGKIKSASSKWIKTKGDRYANFKWNPGYAAFSVYPKDIDVVIGYINNQRAHHSKKKYDREYRDILDRQNMEYDERYFLI